MSATRHFDFLISNPGHHLATALPVIRDLRDRGQACRVVSLCELRGFATPVDRLEGLAETFQLVPWHLRRSPGAGPGGTSSATRRWTRAAAWHGILGPRLRSALGSPPDLVVLPNDAAFPYDRIAHRLRRRRIPFLLLQEGIRFPLPGGTRGPAYGAGGATAIAAWGESSAEYFRGLGVAAERIHLTGCPRFDGTPERPSSAAAEQARARWALTERTLLLLTNPIDDLGFVTPGEKLALVERLARQIAPLFDDPGFSLAVKPHGREAAADFRPALRHLPAERARLVPDAPLADLFAAGSGVIVMASTVGLEALFHGLGLGVLEIPGHGFQYDYVSSGVAQPLSWNAPIAPQIDELMRPSEERMQRVHSYIGRQLVTRDGAAAKVATLALETAGELP